jgi:NhaP-type Na+/H+ or K+/H+ antiporter
MHLIDFFTQFTLILAAGILIKLVCDKFKFPYIIFLAPAGTLLASYNLLHLETLSFLPELVRTLALIIIVFSAGFYLRFREMITQSRAILSLSTIGVIITTIVIAGTGFWLLSIPFVTALLLGALLSGTDPASISGDGKEKKESKILTILRSESVLNAPLTIILPFFILDYLSQVQLGQPIILVEILGVNIFKLVSLAVIGAGAGFVIFKIAQYLIKTFRVGHVEAIALAMALVSYVAAELLGGSGFLAVAVCSIFLSNIRLPEKKWLGAFNSELAFIFTVIVFIMLGAEFTFADLTFLTRLDVVALILALVFGRLIASFVSLSGSNLNLKEKFQLGLISPKGVAPAALAPLLLSPIYGVIGAEKIVVITYVAIIFSILFSLVLLKVILRSEEES